MQTKLEEGLPFEGLEHSEEDWRIGGMWPIACWEP